MPLSTHLREPLLPVERHHPQVPGATGSSLEARSETPTSPNTPKDSVGLVAAATDEQGKLSASLGSRT